MALSNDRPIIVAADLPTGQDVMKLAEDLAGADGVWGLKVHTRHLETFGVMAMVTAIKQHGHKVFVDRKFHDIKTVVADGVATYREHGVDLVTVHASGGKEMVEAAVKAGRPETGILAVTVLTSIAPDLCKYLYYYEPLGVVRRMVEHLLATHPFPAGFVCSAEEVGVVTQMLQGRQDAHMTRDIFRVVPGIRPTWYGKQDEQKRVGTPGQAIRDGATHLVIGRPILEGDDRRGNVARTMEEVREAAGA